MAMKTTGLFLIAAVLLAACNSGPKKPDISGIKVDVEVKRFDQDFFSIDTLNIDASMMALQNKYPQFLGVYLENILGITNPEGLKAYINSYRSLYDSSQALYANFEPVAGQLEKAFRYLKHYFPNYDLPKTIMPVLGPLETREDLARMNSGELTPNFLGPDFVGISLQFYLGKNFGAYQSEQFVTNVAPLFRSRRFDSHYITGDVMRLIADDLYPDRSFTLSLAEQMIEKGKRWWLIKKFMPEAADTVITGYTQVQTEWTEANEGMIWSYIIKNEKLDSKEPATIQTYLGEAPFTIGLPQNYSPGNIGIWLGRQIVSKFEKENPSLSVDQIMNTPAEKILQEAKYKPK